MIFIDTGLNDEIVRLNIGHIIRHPEQYLGWERPKTNILEMITLTKASTSTAFLAVC